MIRYSSPFRPVVGLDPSLRATGLALHDGTLITLTHPSASTHEARVDRMRRVLIEITQQIAAGSLVVIEGPAFGMATKATHELGGMWWAIAVRLAELQCPVIVLSPTALKKFATGKGNSKKSDMRVAWLQRSGVDVADDNQVDAAWLREAGRQITGHAEALTLPAAQRSVLDAVEEL